MVRRVNKYRWQERQIRFGMKYMREKFSEELYKNFFTDPRNYRISGLQEVINSSTIYKSGVLRPAS